MKRILLTSTATSALLLCGTASAELSCVEAPDCRSLGYTKTASQCSGKNHTVCPYDATAYSCEDDVQEPTCSDLGYKDQASWCPNHSLPCPTDANQVKCLSIYKAGDIKYSRQTADHDGWLKCDGRFFQYEQYPELFSVLERVYLPDYRGYYLKAYGGLSQAAMYQKGNPTLPNITGTFAASDNVASNGTFSIFDSGNTSGVFSVGTRGSKPHVVINASSIPTASLNDKITFDASKSNSIYGANDGFGNVNNVNPMHYRINTFIYAGRIGEAKPCDNHCSCYNGEWLSENEVPAFGSYRCDTTTENLLGVDVSIKKCKPSGTIYGCSIYNLLNGNDSRGVGLYTYDSSGYIIFGPKGEGYSPSDICYRYPQCVEDWESFYDAGATASGYCDASSVTKWMIYSCTVDASCLRNLGVGSV